MLFNSVSYLMFLPVTCLLYWLAPAKYRAALLVVASYFFYMSWKPIYGLLLIGMTSINYWIAKKIQAEPAKFWLILGVGFNLLILGIFKYASFAQDLLFRFTHTIGLQAPSIAVKIILPLGISFFVFEFIHYLVDVKRGNPPTRSFLDFLLFASFFPTQIAGPIKRYEQFVPQIQAAKKLTLKAFDEGLSSIIYGLFKKVIVADSLAIVSQTVFPHPEYLTNLDCWLGVYAFAFQIYFDFSGYTDIARGSAQLLGFDIPINFDAPYLAQSPAEFWHRWHVSLSSWLRDYVYIPLGGSKINWFISYRNLLLTMVLGGLWHGAAIHFIVWGAYHGIVLIMHRLWCKATKNYSDFKPIQSSPAYKLLATIITFHIICLGWVFFRADDMRLAQLMLRKVLFLDVLSSQSSIFTLSLPTVKSHLIFPYLLPSLAVLAISHYLCKRSNHPLISLKNGPLFCLKALTLATALCLLLVFSPETTPQFIYFQF